MPSQRLPERWEQYRSDFLKIVDPPRIRLLA
ncbi:hypothetical protein PSEG_03162 [Pseudomonas sp. Nvir]|jgi:hypothetical protein|nr:hypothetical protein PSNVIR_05206 [Pseudomonas sp. Nvir]